MSIWSKVGLQMSAKYNYALWFLKMPAFPKKTTFVGIDLASQGNKKMLWMWNSIDPYYARYYSQVKAIKMSQSDYSKEISEMIVNGIKRFNQ